MDVRATEQGAKEVIKTNGVVGITTLSAAEGKSYFLPELSRQIPRRDRLEMVPPGAMPFDWKHYPLKKWAVVLLDNTAVVYVRRNPGSEPIIEQIEFKNLSSAPLSEALSDRSVAELERWFLDNKNNKFYGRRLSSHLLSKGQKARAAESLNRLVAKASFNSALVREAIEVERQLGDEILLGKLSAWASRIK